MSIEHAPQRSRIVREKDRLAITGVPRASWNRLEKQGQTPKRVILGPRIVGWYEDELYHFNASRPRAEANEG